MFTINWSSCFSGSDFLQGFSAQGVPFTLPILPSSVCLDESLFVSLSLTVLSADTRCEEWDREHTTAHNKVGCPGGWMEAELLPLGTENKCLGQGSMHGHVEQLAVWACRRAQKGARD